MAFTRQNVVTTSTFTTGGVTETSSVPTFTQWENTSNASGFEWNLGNKWTLNVNTDESVLGFKYNNVTAFSINQSGILGIDLSVDATGDKLTLSNLTELPAASSYSDGEMIRMSGELYILENE
jgi:hypothetical protein